MSDLEQITPEMSLAEQVERLMKLPQHLCHRRGNCCRVANFKGMLREEEIRTLALEDTHEGEMARDFLSLFTPISLSEVETASPGFLERILEKATPKGLTAQDVGFFRCRFVLEDGRCGVHEDRPVGCRVYPFPHENTIFHPGCGFEAQAKENWKHIHAILSGLGILDELT
jgi:Fe-S-cluster containining protein